MKKNRRGRKKYKMYTLRRKKSIRKLEVVFQACADRDREIERPNLR